MQYSEVHVEHCSICSAPGAVCGSLKPRVIATVSVFTQHLLGSPELPNHLQGRVLCPHKDSTHARRSGHAMSGDRYQERIRSGSMPCSFWPCHILCWLLLRFQKRGKPETGLYGQGGKAASCSQRRRDPVFHFSFTWKTRTAAEFAFASLGTGWASSAGAPGRRRMTRRSGRWLGNSGAARMASYNSKSQALLLTTVPHMRSCMRNAAECPRLHRTHQSATR